MLGELTEEQKGLVDSISRFARAELAPGALGRAHSQEYPWDVAEKLAGMGLLGITMSEEDGGIGGTLCPSSYKMGHQSGLSIGGSGSVV